MIKESDILKIVKEDILRILGEKKGRASLEFIKEEIKVSYLFISKAIEELKKEKLIRLKQSFFELTKKGKEKAKNILRKHLILENYFKKTKSKKEAHKKAHILEHYVSEEVIKNIKKLSTFKGKGISLTKLKSHKEELIADITISNNELFERIVSMGIFPGEKIKITNKISKGIIVKIENKKFALGEDIAKKIKVMK